MLALPDVVQAQEDCSQSGITDISVRSGNTVKVLRRLGEERTKMMRTQRDLLGLLAEERKLRSKAEQHLEQMTIKLDVLSKKIDDSMNTR